jgi:hypothetical protein
VAGVLARVLLTRAWVATCEFWAMVLVAWLAAFARALLRHGWDGFRTLSATGLSDATAQAGRYAAGLVAVLAVWAVLLLLVPAGYAVAYRAAMAAAAVLGALDFAPPSFLVTSWVAGLASGLTQLTRSHDGILLLIEAASAAYVLHQGALSAFERLEGVPAERRRGNDPASPAMVYAARARCAALSLMVLLVATWSGTVVWLATSHAHGDPASYGLRGSLVLSDYLLALGVCAVLVARSENAQAWLLATVHLAASLGAAANVSPVPRDLVFSIGRGELERIASAWGGDSEWAALFVGFPVCLFGVYVVARVRLVRGPRLLGGPAAPDPQSSDPGFGKIRPPTSMYSCSG